MYFLKLNLSKVTRCGIFPSFSLVKVCDLLDLLGGSGEPPQPSPALSTTALGPVSSTAGGDLLDLLGGLDVTPGETQSC